MFILMCSWYLRDWDLHLCVFQSALRVSTQAVPSMEADDRWNCTVEIYRKRSVLLADMSGDRGSRRLGESQKVASICRDFNGL